MKYFTFFLFILFSVATTHAGLNIEMGIMEPNSTNSLLKAVDRVKGDKVRQDVFYKGTNTESYILNLDTGKGFRLVRDGKNVVKTSFKQSVLTNELRIEPVKDTGQTEIVNGLETEIYTCPIATGGSYTFWIAKNYPKFEIIKKELVKRDESCHATRFGLLNLSTLPGMLMKCQVNDPAARARPLQVAINEEPIDEAIFEMPKDYHEYGHSSVTNTNGAISLTNTPSAKY